MGSAPGLIDGGCHGADEKAVFAELCVVVDEAIELYKRDNTPLPPSTVEIGHHGIRPFPPAGRQVTNEIIDKLREDDAY